MQNKTVDGLIDLQFVNKNGRSFAKRTYREGNSWISFRQPNKDDIPYYFLITTGGGYVEGENYLYQVKLEDNSHAIVTTQSPTYVYKCENHELTSQEDRIHIGKDAFLEFYQDETIPYKDAYYHQNTKIEMEKGAKLILTDGLSSGWSPDDTPFQYSEIGLQTKITYDGRLVYNDYLIVDPEIDPMYQIGYFEGKQNFNSAVIIDENLNQDTVEEIRKYLNQFDFDVHYGISVLEEDGIVLRVLSSSSYKNRKLILKFINYYREKMLNFSKFDLRKSDHIECDV
ncbi:urease accessory protein UreD [Lactobacillus sp. LL6]|uniref:urease accessory protein UreD n=1 Tax=Lactobacillus sp. LL6 TaxID=2596827 RepID=UPI001186778E|nr:urease accessory protein UreD [Lactobacillus sp. LL6]TSO25914.1 urease accessory protein UreD [Lactobacillus sp. LL6]